MSGEDRLMTLELALAHAEAALADLSDMVRRQGDDIAALRRDNYRLLARIERIEDGMLEEPSGFVP